jgi:transposase-like protein
MTQHSSGVEQTPIPASIHHLLDQPIDVKLQLLQHHAELARLLAREILDEEVESLVGKRYSRDHPTGKCYCRWGQNPGSIWINGERMPIDVPRVRDVEAGEERPLESYRSMKRADAGKKLTESILLGLAQGDYQRVASQFVDGFGLSQSSVSRRFTERAEKALREFESRPLEEDNFLALWIDGKHVAGEQMLVCMGVTEAGYKKVLGFTQATAENARPIIEMLRDLIQRGLTFEEGILCVIDGAKGLRKAIREVFGACAQVQRCQWHKRENVVGYLPKADQSRWRKKLQRAYQEPTYEAAKERLLGLHAELEPVNRKAAGSLREGLEETLTLHRLGLFEELGRNLKTTNGIENLMGQVQQRIGKVKRWHHSPQRHRWMALALLEGERRMRRLTGYRHLPRLKDALKGAIPDRE